MKREMAGQAGGVQSTWNRRLCTCEGFRYLGRDLLLVGMRVSPLSELFIVFLTFSPSTEGVFTFPSKGTVVDWRAVWMAILQLPVEYVRGTSAERGDLNFEELPSTIQRCSYIRCPSQREGPFLTCTV